jgi:hypothetical protein
MPGILDYENLEDEAEAEESSELDAYGFEIVDEDEDEEDEATPEAAEQAPTVAVHVPYRDDDPVRAYLREIVKVSLLTAEQESRWPSASSGATPPRAGS